MSQVSTAFEVYQFMSEKNILVAFTGHFDHLVTTSLLKNIKSKLGSILNSYFTIQRQRCP